MQVVFVEQRPWEFFVLLMYMPVETYHKVLAGGIIGHVVSNTGEISVTMSVHKSDPMIGSGSSTHESQNSNNIRDIEGKVYCYQGNTPCWDSNTVWKATLPDGLPMLQAQVLKPTGTATPTFTRSASATCTKNPSSTSPKPKRAQKEVLPVQRARRYVV